MKTLLKGPSKLYSSLMKFRAALYQRGYLHSYKSKLPVISIGNISAGGTGKTPLCLYLCELLKKHNYKPVVLSRGYGGNYKGVHQVKKSDTALVTGDEPLLIANELNIPVILSGKRSAGARYIEDTGLGDVIVLDDGLQHLGLKRDLEIVTLNISNEKDIRDIFENRVIPYGRLREERAFALSRADIIVLSNRKPLSKAKPVDRDFLKLIPDGKTLVSSYFEGKEVRHLTSGEILKPASEVTALAGIANPEGFFETLESLGFVIKLKIVKPDHYIFTESEVRGFEKQSGFPLVCTEKDSVKLSGFKIDKIYKLKGGLSIIDKEVFDNKVTGSLKGK